MTVTNILFVYVAERQRLPLLALVLVGVLIVPILGTKTQFRQIVSRAGVENTTDRLTVFGDLISEVFTGKRNFSNAKEIAESRMDHLSVFAYVVTKTGTVVPYWNGATYENFFWSFVPRVLAPDKPLKGLGQAYGHRYGFLTPHDYHTSMNLEQTVEMYANFGTAGVVIGMLLLGLLYRILHEVLNRPGAGDGGILIAAATFRTLLNIESDFSLVFGGIVQAVVLLYIALWLLARGRDRTPAPAPA